MKNKAVIEYSRHDTLLLKGLAIIAIVFHNYFHWLYTGTKENEFNFSPENFTNMLVAIGENHWEFIHAFFTYFGHFGVVVFIFISAYGLAKSHPNINHPFPFVVARFKKIYPSLIIALIMWLIFFGRKQGLTMGPILYFWDNVDSISYLLLGISNLIPGYALKPVGPWWFIPFILQFYILFPFLIQLLSKFHSAALLLSLLGLLLNIFVNPLLIEHFEINLLFTPFGHLPEICLGIYAVKNKISFNVLSISVVLVLFGLSNLYEFWWAFHNITALILLLWLYSFVKEFCGKCEFIDRSLAFVGIYSMGLFLINGFLRSPFVGTAAGYNSLAIEVLFGIANFIVCLIFAIILERVHVLGGYMVHVLNKSKV